MQASRQLISYAYVWFSLPPAKDLIKRLLKTDPDERLVITEVIKTPWIAVSLCLLS